MKINVLHISDFHYRAEHDKDYRDAVDLLCESLKEEKIDIVVFSGDLVNSVNDVETINKAYSVLFDSILDRFKIGKERLLVVPGNHDFKNISEMNVISEGLEKIDSIKALDSFCKDNRQLDFSMERFALFNEAFREYFGDSRSLSSNGLYSYNSFIIDGIKIKLLGLNSAWRSSLDSKQDRGKLLYPIGILNEAFADADKYDIVLCAMHQQPQDFKEFIATDFEDRVARDCHILFSGHYHKFKVEEIDDDYSGFIHCVAPATFNRYDRDSQYGMCLVSIDLDTRELLFCPFFKAGSSFVAARQISKKLPLSEVKRKAVDLNKTLKEVHREAIKKSDDLFLTGHVYDPGYAISFDELFVEPIIRDQSWRDSLINEKKGLKVSVNDLVTGKKNDAVLFGLNKCGKTSLLYKILLCTMENLNALKTIPYYINCKAHTKNKNFSIDLEQALARELHLNRNDTRSLFESTTLLLLLDDFDASNTALVENINSQLKRFTKVRIIITAEETLSGEFDASLLKGHELSKLYFHTITTNEIHQLTLKWPGLDMSQKRIAEEKIAQIFRQMHIPFNYWTASLFLWILKKTSPENVHNNFELVEFYVNELLDQRGIVEGRQLNVQYADFKAYLGELAAFLLSCDEYSITREGLLAWSNDYRARVLKYTETAENTIAWLLDHAVLVEYNNAITFRLKGVFEFFIAYNMSRNTSFKDSILYDEHCYLSFGNELELLAGFKPEDESLVEEVFNKTKSIYSSLMEDERYTQVDNRLESKNLIIPGHSAAVKELAELLSTMTQEEDVADVISTAGGGVPVDSSGVELKKRYEEITPTLDNLEQSLFILSRVFRNSDMCNNQERSNVILDFILLAACNLGIDYADELTRNAEDEESVKLVNVVSRLMPIVIETFLYDALCQNNLGRALNIKLEELAKAPEGKEFMIFILAFMLIDLNVETYSSALSIVDNCLKKGILRYSAYSKLLLIVLKNTGSYKAKQLLHKINSEMRIKSKNELELLIQQDKTEKKQQKIINMKDYNEEA